MQSAESGCARLSLIIPTYKRPRLLAAALQSVARSRRARSALVEVIVVDNSPGNEGAEIVDRMAPEFPHPLFYLEERQHGVSCARNTGAAFASGTHLVFMDDDQSIDADYLARVPETFAETDADCAGGWIGYTGADAFPPWLRRLVRRMGQRDLGPAVRAIERGDVKLAGGNLIVRKDVFHYLGGFRHDLLRSQDIELQERILGCGGSIVYDPALRQYHTLEPARMTRRYYLARAFAVGRAEYRMDARAVRAAPQLLGAPRFLWRRAAQSVIDAASTAPRSADERFDHLCDAAGYLGQLCEALGGKPLDPVEMPIGALVERI